MSSFIPGAGSASPSSSSAPDLANGGVEAIRDTVTRSYEDARDQIEHALGAARKNLSRADGYLRDQIRDRPITAAATAVGIGVVLGMVLSGRRS